MDLQHDLQPDLHRQWTIQWQIQWTLSLITSFKQTEQKLWRGNRYRVEASTNTDNREIQTCKWISSEIYRRIFTQIYRIFKTDRTEIVERKQIQGRGIHKYRQQRDPDLQTDLQSDLQKDPHLNLQDLQDLQADLQKDLQANLQMDLQTNLQVKARLEATQISSLVSFPLQAETSTEERPTSCFNASNNVHHCVTPGTQWRRTFVLSVY